MTLIEAFTDGDFICYIRPLLRNNRDSYAVNRNDGCQASRNADANEFSRCRPDSNKESGTKRG